MNKIFNYLLFELFLFVEVLRMGRFGLLLGLWRDDFVGCCWTILKIN